MKKLYRKGTVHPALPVSSSSSDHHLLSFLPAAILTLTVALSTEEREVLAYLISCSSSSEYSSSAGNHHHRKTKTSAAAAADHSPSFNCNCFRCYMSYWVKWDVSPNRQLIHEIIDAFEDSLLKEGKKEKKKERRRGKIVKLNESRNSDLILTIEPKSSEVINFEEGGVGGDVDDDVYGEEEEEEFEKGSVRKLVGYIGERIWSVWG